MKEAGLSWSRGDKKNRQCFFVQFIRKVASNVCVFPPYFLIATISICCSVSRFSCFYFDAEGRFVRLVCSTQSPIFLFLPFPPRKKGRIFGGKWRAAAPEALTLQPSTLNPKPLLPPRAPWQISCARPHRPRKPCLKLQEGALNVGYPTFRACGDCFCRVSRVSKCRCGSVLILMSKSFRKFAKKKSDSLVRKNITL